MNPVAILALFELKHFLADYPFQNKWMLKKFSAGWEYVAPLSVHCLIHWAFTMVILYNVAPHHTWLATVEFVIHFVMDRIKASPKLLGRYQALAKSEYRSATTCDAHPIRLASHCAQCWLAEKNESSNKYFWWSLGFDQMVHHLNYLGIVYYITK